MILDTQELAASREKERQLRQDMAKIQTDLDKERLKNKTISDKVFCSMLHSLILGIKHFYIIPTN